MATSPPPGCAPDSAKVIERSLLRPSSKPQWDTIRSLLLALGLEIRVVPTGSVNGSVLAA